MADGTRTPGFGGKNTFLFVAVEVDLGNGFLRLLDGASEVTFSGRTFTGLDPTFGTLASLDAVTDGFGDTAPSLRLGINPASPSASAILCAPDMQTRSVLIWLGAFDTATGTVVPDPLLIFNGEVDQGILRVGMGTRALTLECVSVWERLFEDREGVRLTNAYHQTVWPGELGLEFVTAVTRSLPWGSDLPRPDVVRDALYRKP
jgi:hypothetical protein